MDSALVPVLSRMVDKVSRMRPIPSCDDLFDQSWGKVDQLILKVMKAMKEKGLDRPLHPLSETLFDMAMQDVAEHFPETNQALQAATYRAMDTRLLVDEFGRMRQMAVLIRDAAEGKEVKFPFHNFPPESPAMIPPSFTPSVYEGTAVDIVDAFADELRNRKILPPRKEDG